MPVNRIKQKIRHVDSTKNPIGKKKSILQPGKVIVNNYKLFTPFYCVSSPVLSATPGWLNTARPGKLLNNCKLPGCHE